MSRNTPIRYGRVSPLQADWRGSVTETYEFKTEVIEARDGLEQRAALRENPRYTLEHRTLAFKTEIQRYLGDLVEGQHLPFHVPQGWRRVFLSAAAAAPVSGLSVSEVPFWLVPGRRLVISGGGQVEAAEVLSITGNTVALAAALRGTFPAGSTVYAAISARAQDGVDFRAETGTIWQGNVVWEQDPAADPWSAPNETVETYEGFEVFTRKPNWRDRPRLSIQQMREIMDAGRGTVAVSTPTGESQLESRLLFSGFDPATADSLLAFFLRQKGKRGAFWMPTWQQDVPILSGLGTVTTLAGEDAFFAYSASRVFNTLVARHPDGSYQVNRIASWATTLGNTSLTMAEPWAAPLTASSLVMWCPMWRFATDRLEIERVTGTVSEMQFSVLSLIQESS